MFKKYIRNTIPLWLVITLLVFAGVGTAAALLPGFSINNLFSVGVSQSVLIDGSRFDEQDVSDTANRRFVSVSDDGTSFTAAAEIATGDEVTIDVPLINTGNTDATVELRLEYSPEIYAIAEPFWTTETVSFSVPEGTITEEWFPPDGTPTPDPYTDHDEQAEDTSEVTNPPSGLLNSTAERDRNLTSTTVTSNNSAPITLQPVTSVATGTRPSGAPDSRSGTWYTGNFMVDLDADAVLEEVYFVLTDNAVSGIYNTMDISTDDNAFGETQGGLLDNDMTGPQDDERITGTTAVRFGPFYTFTADFDSSPSNDGNDARITSKTWFIDTVTGTDLDGDGAADDTFYTVLTDDDSDGIYEKLDISIGDDVFGEGALGDLDPLGGVIVDYSAANNTNDERLTAAAENNSGNFKVKLGTYTFTFSFDTTPGGLG